MTEAVTPPNPDQSQAGKNGNPPQSVPDPTLMTIDALRREIAMLENLLETRIQAMEQLTKERFHRVDEDMRHFEQQRKEQKQDSRSAVDAALASQKEATSKMESAMASQIDSLKNNFETAIVGVRTTQADLKDRLTILESIKQGQVEQKTERREVTSAQVAGAGVIVALFVAMMTVISFAFGG